MERYFVSYSYSTPHRFGFGHTETTIDRKITGIDVIKYISGEIEKTFGYPKGSTVILNFQRFDEE